MLFTSPILAGASGSVGGITASRNAGGPYFRTRAVPVDPGTSLQQAVRSAVGTLTSRWQDTLTGAQRAAWETYSNNVPLVGPLGNSRVVGALPMYIRSNVPRLQAGLPRVDDGPTVYNLGDFGTVSFSAISGTGGIVAYDDTDAWCDEDDSAMLLYVSQPLSATINFFKGPFRLTAQVDGDSSTPPTSPATPTLLQTFASGTKGVLRARVSRADGRLSSSQIVSVIAS